MQSSILEFGKGRMSKGLARDGDWGIVDGRLCKVSHFSPSAMVKDGKVASAGWRTPYASVVIECVDGKIKLPQNTLGTVTHRLDFRHLWAAFVERGIENDEVVVIVWTKKYTRLVSRILSPFMPRMTVMIFKDRAYNLLIDSNLEPNLRGEARFLAELPSAEWRPDKMK